MRQQLHDWWQQWVTAADEVATLARGEFNRSFRGVSGEGTSGYGALEPRILFSATPIDPGMMPGGDEVATVMEVDTPSPESSTVETLAESSTVDQSPREVVIIDAAVPDIEQLLQDLNGSGRNVEVFVLESDRDGIDQITEILDGRSDIAAVHIVSHAEGSSVKLGNLRLGESNLSGYAGSIASWQSSLTSSADILFYGCDLASDPSGQTFLDAFSRLTGADVAASDDDTGHSRFDGDWDLEYATGVIEAEVAFSDQLQQHWQRKLATITVNTFTDEFNGGGTISLREAIDQATAGDTIVLGSGTYRLTLGNSGDDSGSEGDLDITKDLFIEGAADGSTIISGENNDRVFHVIDSNLTMSDVTIENGSIADKGGGIFVDGTSSELTLDRVIIRNNFGDEGGGIFNEGTITLTDVVIANNGDTVGTSEGGGINNREIAILNRVTISGNKADTGGGIHNDNSGGTSLTMTNVTVSGNTAASGGGGLYSQNTATIINSTFTLNEADSGGGIRVQSGDTTINNTIVSGNSAISANDDVQGSFNSSSSFNLIGDDTGSSNLVDGVNGNLVGDGATPIDAMLEALADNGGFGQTHALQAGSLAINSGGNQYTAATDHAGATRDSIPDIGAFESTSRSTKIYWTESGSNSIYRSNGDGTAVQQIASGLGSPTGLEIDLEGGKLYWIESTTNSLHSSNLDGSGAVALNTTDLVNPTGLGIDTVNGHLYVADDGDGADDAIRRFNLDGSGFTTLVSNLDGIIGDVAIDVVAERAYFTVDGGGSFDGKIQWVSLSGGAVTTLKSGLVGPQSLVIDQPAGRLYYSDNGGLGLDYIVGIDLSDGGNTQVVASSGLSAPLGIAFDAANQKVYWGDEASNFIGRGNPDATGTESILTGLSGPQEIVVFTMGNTDPTVANPITDQTATQDSAFNFQFASDVFGDADGDSLTYSATLIDLSALPSWLTFTAATRTFSGTPTDGDIGTITVRVTADDGNGGNVFDEFLLTINDVNDAPTVTLTPVVTDLDEDTDTSSAVVVATISVTDDALGSANLSLSGDDAAYFEIVGSDLRVKAGTVFDFETNPSLDVTVNVDDPALAGSPEDSDSYSLTINDVTEAFENTDEFRINETVGDEQITIANGRGSQHAVSTAGDGSYVVVWSSLNQDGSGQGVYARRFDSTGTPITGEIQVHESTTNDQQFASVASAADGTFVITWTSNHGGDSDVYYRRFASDGMPITGETLVNTTTSGIQGNPSIAMNRATGEFVVVWQGNGSQAGEVDNAGVFAQRYDSSGATVGGEFRVNASTSGSQSDVGVSMNTSGEFVVTWDDGSGFHFQRFDSSGLEQGGQVTVDGSSVAGNGSVAMHSDGSFVVVWREGAVGARDVYAQRFNAGGTTASAIQTVASSTTGNQTNPSIAMDSTGAFIVVWEGEGTRAGHSDASGVFGQRFDAGVNAIGDEFRVNDTTTGIQAKASAAMLDSDNFVVVWSGNGNQPGEVDSTGVFAQQFGNASSNAAPTVTNPIADQNATEDAPFSFTFASDVFDDADGDSLRFAATLAGGGALPSWLSFDDTTRTFSGTPTNEDVGSLTIRVFANDGNLSSVFDDFVLTVNNVNDDPTVDNPISDQSATQDVSFNFQFASDVFGDLDGDSLTYTATLDDSSPLPSWLTFEDATRTFSGTPTQSDVGSITVRVTADDGNGGSVFDDFVLTVNNVNDDPTVDNPIADQSATQDVSFNFQFASDVFGDLDGDSLTYTATLDDSSPLPSWLTFEDATRTFSGTPTQSDVGSITVRVTADDGNGGSVFDDFVLTVNNVNDDPTVDNPIADQSATQDVSFNFQFASDVFGDLDGDSLDYTATLDDSSPLPSWLTFEDATRTFSGTPTQSDVGSITVRVTADDGNGGSVFDDFVLTVNNVNDDPTVDNPIADQSATQDVSFNFQFASDVFGDLDGDSLTYTAALDDSSPLPSWLTFDDATRIFSGTPANSDVGSITIRVTADDGNGGSVFDDFVLTVNNVNDDPTVENAISDQVAAQDAPFSFQFAADTFDDVDGDSLSYSATLDDSSPLPAWLTFDDATRTFSGTPANSDVGSITIRVTAEDGNGGSVSDEFVLTVDDLNESPTDITLDNSNVAENADGAVIGELEVFDPDTGDVHLLSVDDSRFEISGTRLQLKAGQMLDKETEPTLSVTVTATDMGGAGISFDKSFTITVDDVNEVPTNIALSNSAVTEGEEAAVIGRVAVADPDAGDIHTFVVDDARFEIVGGNLQLTAGQSLDHDVEPTVEITITATDLAGTGLSYDQSFTIVVDEDRIIPLPLGDPPADPGSPPSESDRVDESDSESDSESESESDSESGSDDESGDGEAVASIGVPHSSANSGDSDDLVSKQGVVNPHAAVSAIIDLESQLSGQNIGAFFDSQSGLSAKVGGNTQRVADSDAVSPTETISQRIGRQIEAALQADYVLMSRPGEMWDQLDEQKNFVESQIQGDLIVIGSTGAAASGFTVGVVAWALRSGFLVSGLMAQMPLYRAVDPLLIMGSSGAVEGGETLAEMMDRQSKELDE